MNVPMSVKGRGAQINTPDPFSPYLRSDVHPDKEQIEEKRWSKTQYIEVHPKTIVNKVFSPDVNMDYSINPYQGCEHGCAYCYARNTHPFWGYSAGLEFESRILVKKNAPVLLRRFLCKKNWRAVPIVLSGNTDCYQPAEEKFKITRALLEVFLEFKHPVGIITKNALLLRDTDLLRELAKDNLVKVIFSITTTDDKLRQQLEPRTTTIGKRFKAIAALAESGIPVSIMVAPIIPGINNHEIVEIIRMSAIMGATGAGMTIARLNGDVEPIFEDWLTHHLPERRAKVMNQIKSCHGGRAGDSRFGKRLTGEGKIAQMIKDQFKLAVRQYMPEAKRKIPLNTELFDRYRSPQMMFDF